VNTRGTTKLQIGAMVGFALTCFGLLLFLWGSFGGSIPLKPKGYRFEISFPEATTLATEADVRVSGVSVGKVRKLVRDPNADRTIATVELLPEYAPVHKDAQAILRQKTLLGETYVEMTLGHQNAGIIQEGGKLENGQVADTVQLDEVLALFPKKTRADFQRWQANSAAAIQGRGGDFNAAVGNLGPFATSGADLVEVLDANAATLQDLVANTSRVFGAITQDEGQLRAFIADSADWLQATARARDNLALSFKIFPTFLRESRTTLSRIERFSVDTKPLIDDLGPVARDLQPTLRDLRAAAPDLQSFFVSLPAAINASRAGSPALSKVLRGLIPVLDSTGPFLSQLNPILSWLQYQQGTVANFIAGPGWALQGKSSSTTPGANGHVLPQLIVAGSQTLVSPTRDPANRGNTYFDNDALNNASLPQYGVPASYDCGNTTVHQSTGASDPSCFVAPNSAFGDGAHKYAHVLASSFKETKKQP
jgi:phospholipid/cholesterol/gamma-HCH transport system substrate-binding protein